MNSDLRERLEALSAGATQGEWTALNMVHEDGRPMTPQELGEYVKNAVQMSDEERFLFVSGNQDGKDVDICHVGNGPKGPANARLIEVLVNAFRSGHLVTRTEMEEAVAKAVAAEREGCAEIAMKISEEFMKNHGMAETKKKRFDVYDMQRFANKGILLCGEDIDKAIRARSEQKEGE